MHVADETVVVTTLTGDEAKPPSRNPFPQQHHRSGRRMPARRWSATRSPGPSAPLGGRRTIGAPNSIPTNCTGGCAAPASSTGPAFQGIVGLTVSDSGAARADVRLPAAAKPGSRRFLLHPVMLDVALQALGATKVATDLAAPGRPTRPQWCSRSAWPASGSTATSPTVSRAVGSLHATARPDRFVGQVVADRRRRRRCCWKSTRSRWRCCAAPGPANELTNRLFALEWEPVDARQTGRRRSARCCWSAIRRRRPAPGRAAVGLVEQTAHCEVVSAGARRAQLRNALTRKDIEWDGIVVVCPPRAVDEALPDRDQLELAQSRTLLIADIVKTRVADGRQEQPTAVDRHPGRTAGGCR